MENDKKYYPGENKKYVSVEELQKMGEFETEKEVAASALILFGSAALGVTEDKKVMLVDEEDRTMQELILPVFETLRGEVE